MSATAAEQLVQTLIDETKADRLVWEPADSFETAFIAKRPSGTVVVEAAGIGAVTNSRLATLTARLLVKDSKGNVIQRIDATSALGGVSIPGTAASAGVLVPKLYELIRQQRAKGDERLLRLAEEFKSV